MDQYHPLNVPTELAPDLGPAIYIWDCCNAGLIIEKFNEKFAPETGKWKNFHFACCGPTEYRPIRKDVPTDIFTQCLTNPIKTALKWALEKDSASIICPDIKPIMIDRYLPDR
jgi:regulator-associated protein of mTOR